MSLRKEKKRKKSIYIHKIDLFKYINIYNTYMKKVKYTVMSERRLLSGVF